MEKLVIYFVFLLFSGAHKILAYTSDHSMDRLDYMEDRLNAESARLNAESSRLNAESKVRKKEFNILYNKLGHIETMLHDVIEMKETKSDTFRFNDGTGAVSGDKMKKTLLKALKDEKVQNIRFRREISYDMRKQTEHLKKAYERNENSLNNISREVELLRQEVANQHVDSKETAKHFRQNIEEHIQNLRPPVNFTKETVETISLNVETLKEQITNISVNLQNGIHFQNTCPGNALEEKLEVTSVQPVKRYKSCLELYNNGFKSNGVFDIEIHQSKVDKTVAPVYCDMTTDDGGWTVFQRRQDGSVDFNRDWNDYKIYKYGFGELDGEFWLGNEYVNILTDDGETHELRIDLEDHDGNRAYAKYSKFKVGPESTNYKLEVSGYTGDAGDSLFKPGIKYRTHNGMQFSTKDMDNDLNSDNCASYYNDGWWFNSCFDSNLNGLYGRQSRCSTISECIVWSGWKGYFHNMKFTEMKLR